MQVACNEFFADNFSLDLISVSKNINILFQGDDYFVTKIRIDKQHDVFFRSSGEAIKIILDKTLGENKEFDLTTISELEAKIISSFNDYLYTNISKFLMPPPNQVGSAAQSKKRRNFDVIHLTLFIKDKQANEGAKLILSIPQVLLAPSNIISEHQAFDVADFKKSKLEVNINVGTTKFPLKDIKSLEKEDIVVFENSKLHSMKLIYKNYKKDFKINQNVGLITPKNNDNDNGGNNMEENSLSQSLWDNIQVEMSAEFEKVKITLGELKNIEQGLVVDISSVYDNRISLLVENKTIAKGELVIINDRYGVRIDEVFSSEQQAAEKQTPAATLQGGSDPIEEIHHEEHTEQENEEVENTNEEFDYSDFELDDQDI